MSTPDTKPVGFVMTVERIYEGVQKIEDKLNNDLSQIKAQLAVLWAFNGILIAAITALVVKVITG